MKKFSINPSSLSFCRGGRIITEQYNACPRHILATKKLKDLGLSTRFDIPKIYMAIGELGEELIKMKLGLDAQHRELALEHTIGEVGQVFRGRMDFYYRDKGIVYEVKSTISKNIRREAIKKGVPKVNHLAQVAAYMMFENCDLGYLIYVYFEFDSELSLTHEWRQYTVTIEDDNVMLDDEPSGYTMTELYDAIELIKWTLTQEAIPAEAPISPKEQSVCGLCPFNKTCFEISQGYGEFLPKALALLTDKERKDGFNFEPKIFRRKKKRK